MHSYTDVVGGRNGVCNLRASFLAQLLSDASFAFLKLIFVRSLLHVRVYMCVYDIFSIIAYGFGGNIYGAFAGHVLEQHLFRINQNTCKSFTQSRGGRSLGIHLIEHM